MDIKEILLNGGYISLDYKENKNDWIGSAKIIAFSGGFGMSPKICVEVPTAEINGRKEFEYDDIDNAIELYVRLVFSVKNLCYKKYEAMINLFNKGNDLDLGIDEDFDLMETERNLLIKNHGKKKN